MMVCPQSHELQSEVIAEWETLGDKVKWVEGWHEGRSQLRLRILSTITWKIAPFAVAQKSITSSLTRIRPAFAPFAGISPTRISVPRFDFSGAQAGSQFPWT